jgi:glycosyltransferase involved in cell wall biosynthesis
VSYELVLVANYDTESDITPQIVRDISKAKPHIIPLTNLKKGKMGWDMRTGLSVATGKYIAVIDGDGQMPVSDLIVVYNLIKTGDYDLVKTYREKRFDGFQRVFISKAYNIFFSLLFRPKTPIRDINAKPKIMTRDALHSLHLESDDWFTDAEIIIQAIKAKWRIFEVATVFYKNPIRGSFINWKTVVEFLLNLITYKWKEIKNHWHSSPTKFE